GAAVVLGISEGERDPVGPVGKKVADVAVAKSRDLLIETPARARSVEAADLQRVPPGCLSEHLLHRIGVAEGAQSFGVGRKAILQLDCLQFSFSEQRLDPIRLVQVETEARFAGPTRRRMDEVRASLLSDAFIWARRRGRRAREHLLGAAAHVA